MIFDWMGSVGGTETFPLPVGEKIFAAQWQEADWGKVY